MRTRLVTLLTCFCTPLLLLAALVRFAAPSPAAAQTQPHDNFDSILTTELQAALAEQPDGESIRFIIHFHGDSNLQSFSNKPEAERAAAIVHQLQTSANQTQGRTLAALNQLQDAQSIESYQQLWIINAVSVIGQPEAIERLASDPAIEKIDVDFEIQSLNDETAPIGIEEFAVTTQPVTQTLNNWGIEHIRAAHVWHGLDIDGAGVVIGILDTGIDYSHPDLRPNYRGNLGNGTFDHSTSWHHVVNPSVITEPVDLFGHGTHVAGIAVGQNGIGIAPGAEWIGVGIFEDGGALFDSNAIAGLQWMIAPNGDANSAPDIINCSWGDDRGDRDTLVEAMDAIRQAGIIPICAAGNAGPDGGTIGSPASFASTFAVGAHDDANYVAWFSARGPSPFFDAPHPHIVAPGTAVLSTFPNDIYAIASGTSMAAPHTSGAAALFLTQQPNIATDDLFELLTETAVPISDTHPNMSSGWGRLDAYNLVTQAADFGTLRGQITDDSGPLANIEIQIETPAGYTLDFVTDATGSYEANLASGNYIITVDLFGYEPISLSSVAVNLNQTTNQNINLTHPPSNLIQGQIRSSERNNPLEHVVITVEGVDSPLATTDANGNYQLSLPHGQYKLAYTLLGYEINRQTIVVQAGPTQQLDFSLDSKTTVLLVDSGQWHYDSKISFYETVLDDLNHPADVHAIRDPFHDIPSAEQLAQYDTVIWSDPIYSPGSIGASSAITEYLESGGNLVVSGQNVAAFDSSIFAVPWWQLYMKANFLGQRVITQPIAGAIDTPFSGFSLGVNGTGSARNQFALDGVQGQQGTFAEPLFYYADGDPAAIGVGQCEDYEIAMLGFGLEGISFSFTRAYVLQTLFDYFEEPDDLVGLRWLADDIADFGVPGQAYSYTVTVQNVSEAYTDTISIQLDGDYWHTSVMTPTMTLGPCEIAETTISITVPEDAPKDERHDMKVTAVSTLNPASKPALTFEHKVPGSILLVDDDRWYDQEILYQRLLNSNGLPQDVWETTRGIYNFSPPLELLLEYDFIIWYTAYDWFQPISPDEREVLEAYLDQGGRLFLTSQDFMFYHHRTALAQDYFGAIGYHESVSPTAMFGGGIPGYSQRLAGPLPLTYGNYRNFSDGLTPRENAEILFWHNAGLPAAIGYQGATHRAALMSVPMEKLPADSHAEVLNHMVGWISDLGGSLLTIDNRASQPGEARTYTITVQNASIAPTNWVTVTNVLTDGLSLNIASLTGGATYNAASRTISWHGELESGETKTISYEATPDVGLATGTAVENSVTFEYARHLVAFNSYATTWIAPPDLHTSSVSLAMNRPVAPDRITFTLWITNSGLAATNGITAVVYLPDHINPVSSTMSAPFGTPQFDEERFIWAGDLNSGQAVSASMAFTRNIGSITQHIQTAAAFEDGVTGAIMVPFEAFLQPYRRFFAFAANQE